MAEQTTDLVCQKLGLEKPCETAEKPLPGSEPDAAKLPRKTWSVGQKAAFGRHGGEVAKMEFKSAEEICECEHVTRAEIAYAVKELGVKTLDDLRRRTRVGMGTCQSSFCVLKAAKVLAEELGDPALEKQLVRDFLRERWKGIKPVCWGDQMREAEHMRNLYKEAAK